MRRTRTDYVVDDDGVMVIENGDFKVADSDQQHVNDIFKSNKAQWPEWPLVGFDAIKYIKSKITNQEFARNLKEQLLYDGYDTAEIKLIKGIEEVEIKV